MIRRKVGNDTPRRQNTSATRIGCYAVCGSSCGAEKYTTWTAERGVSLRKLRGDDAHLGTQTCSRYCWDVLLLGIGPRGSRGMWRGITACLRRRGGTNKNKAFTLQAKHTCAQCQCRGNHKAEQHIVSLHVICGGQYRVRRA